MSMSTNEEINSLIYTQPTSPEPTRYQMIRFSTWRIYFYQELESLSTERVGEFKKHNQSWIDKFPHLVSTKEDQEFYSDFLNDCKIHKQTEREDIISHFICRMLFCHDNTNHAKFVQMEKTILSIRLNRRLASGRKKQMELLKKILSQFLGIPIRQFDVSPEDWKKYSPKILTSKKDDEDSIEDFALVPLQHGQVGLRRRSSFVLRGQVYMSLKSTIELVCNLYANLLRSKLEKMRGPVMELINNDVENQLSAFLRKTLETLNTSNFDEVTINSQFSLNLKNVQALWKRFFPPCMLNLNQKLKQHNHLKHDGRRQLWLFLKGCGMDAHDNQQYFRKHFVSKVSNSELKSHMYNIQHAYGLVGKRQPEWPKNCRNLISGPAPKKDQHHGCPFAHWRKEDLKQYLRKYYNISEVNLEEVIKEKQENHFQVACGRLFQGVEKAEGKVSIPSSITARLGKSPHEYFQAGVELLSLQNNPKGGNKAVNEKKEQNAQIAKQSIEF